MLRHTSEKCILAASPPASQTQGLFHGKVLCMRYFFIFGSWAHWREPWLFVSNVLACVSWYAKLLWIAVGCTTYLTHVCRQDMCVYDWNSVWAVSADPPARSLPGEMWRGDHVALSLHVGICVKDRTFFL